MQMNLFQVLLAAWAAQGAALQQAGHCLLLLIKMLTAGLPYLLGLQPRCGAPPCLQDLPRPDCSDRWPLLPQATIPPILARVNELGNCFFSCMALGVALGCVLQGGL